jgi:hypothetical protein
MDWRISVETVLLLLRSKYHFIKYDASGRICKMHMTYYLKLNAAAAAIKGGTQVEHRDKQINIRNDNQVSVKKKIWRRG